MHEKRDSALTPTLCKYSIAPRLYADQFLFPNGFRFHHRLDARRPELRQLHIPDQPERLQGSYAVPVHIELIPRQPMARRLRMRVMVIVPAFAEAEVCHPPQIARVVVGGKAFGA